METSLHSAAFLTIVPGEKAVGEFEVLNKPRSLRTSDIIIIVALLLLSLAVIGIPLLVAFLLYIAFWRKGSRGYVVLTTERLGYYETSFNAFGQGHLVYQISLEDLVGLDVVLSSALGTDAVGFTVKTPSGNDFEIAVKKVRFALLALFFPSTVGKDTYTAAHMLYGLADAVRRRQ
jgi:hypothetical protein